MENGTFKTELVCHQNAHLFSFFLRGHLLSCNTSVPKQTENMYYGLDPQTQCIFYP